MRFGVAEAAASVAGAIGVIYQAYAQADTELSGVLAHVESLQPWRERRHFMPPRIYSP